MKEREEGRTSLTRDKIYPRVCLRFFRPRLKITFSPIKCGYSFTGSLLASLRAKREFTMHAKYSSVTLLCIPFPFVSLRYFAYIYTHTHVRSRFCYYIHFLPLVYRSPPYLFILLRSSSNLSRLHAYASSRYHNFPLISQQRKDVNGCEFRKFDYF